MAQRKVKHLLYNWLASRTIGVNQIILAENSLKNPKLEHLRMSELQLYSIQPVKIEFLPKTN